jgi:hypothetical protein
MRVKLSKDMSMTEDAAIRIDQTTLQGMYTCTQLGMASQEPELLLLVGVGVFGSVAHHFHEVSLILIHSHHTLRHGAELLSLLDHQLTGQKLLADLQPTDESWVWVAGGVVIPPRLGRILQLVRDDSDTLLVGVDGEVGLGLDHLEPIISVDQIVRVAEGGGLKADEPLDLLLEVFL